MRFASLGSGSKGNATLVASAGTRLLVDCGFGLRETRKRLQRLGLEPDDISAILVTHEHSDHAAGVKALSEKHSIPVYLTSGTALAMGRDQLSQAREIEGHGCFTLGDIEVTPVAVPHDAREPTQFVFDDGHARLGLLTDLGHVTEHVVSHYDGCSALMLESNHCFDLLQTGPYPAFLKRRVGGNFGHLNNLQAAELLARIDVVKLRHLVACHISEQNNEEERVMAALAPALNCSSDWIQVADQNNGFAWREC